MIDAKDLKLYGTRQMKFLGRVLGNEGNDLRLVTFHEKHGDAHYLIDGARSFSHVCEHRVMQALGNGYFDPADREIMADLIAQSSVEERLVLCVGYIEHRSGREYEEYSIDVVEDWRVGQVAG